MQLEPGQAHHFDNLRRHPRFKLDTEIAVHCRSGAVVRGRTDDLSASGISAILKMEVRINEIVRLRFSLPLGEVEIHALVRQRTAFRYGFQFLDGSSAQDLIDRTCRELAAAQARQPSEPV